MVLLIIFGSVCLVMVLFLMNSQVEVVFGLLICCCFLIPLFGWESSVEYSFLLNMDLVSFMMVVLTVYIGCLMVLSSYKVSRFYNFKMMVLSICLILVLSFSVSSVFLFYLCFESVLIPTVFLILGWGYQPERVQAVSYMLIYTVMGSMPLIYGLVSLYTSGYSSSMTALTNGLEKNVICFSWLFVLAFLVKLPVFPFHLWLPKAHVEAPVSGSMILAGLLLKLGGYGFIRLLSFVELLNMSEPMALVLSVGLFGGFITSVICLRQVDLKSLVAYSSIGHMSFVLLGVSTNTNWGVLGGVLIMLGHGLCSSGLFSFVNYMYGISNSRLICLNKGYLLVSPFLSLFAFLLAVSNMASPPSLNLFGELLVFLLGGCISVVCLCLLGFMSFMAACYSLYLYVSSQHGKTSIFFVTHQSFSVCGSAVLLAHWLPLNILFCFVPWLSSLMKMIDC